MNCKKNKNKGFISHFWTLGYVGREKNKKVIKESVILLCVQCQKRTEFVRFKKK